MGKFLFSNIKTRRLLYRGVLFLGDFLCVILALRLSFQTRFQSESFLTLFPVTKGFPLPDIYFPIQGTALGIWIMVFIVSGFYQRINLFSLDELLRILRGVFVGWVIVLAATFLYRGVEYSRLVLMLSGIYTFGLVFAFREIMKWLYDHGAARWWEPHTILILGTGRMAKSIQRVLGWHREISLVHKSTRDPEQLKQYLSEHPIKEVFLGEPDLDHTTLIAMSDVCDEFDVPFKIVPDVLELRMGEVIFDDSLGLPTYRVKPISLHGWTYFYKRLFDVVCSTLILSLMLFPLLFIAFLIRIDSAGPIFYYQPRMGHRRRVFPFLKFRTMVANADVYLEELKKKSERSGPVFKMKSDPRVTWVGKFLRKYSLDEVPQIINVLRGQMSLVGPRPQVLWEASAYDEWAKKRLNVLPGITGLWQVSGRAQLSYEQMIDLDIFYIEHWSPGLDLRILLRTIPTILLGQGAY
jgi:exopolysaccharide biosynthesis polyprenyl glycosylphosphotransferase